MNKIVKGLFLYSLLAAVFFNVSGFMSAKTNSDILFQLVLLPVSLYFLFLFIREVIVSLNYKTPLSIPLEGNPAEKKTGFLVAFAIMLILVGISLFRIITQ